MLPEILTNWLAPGFAVLAILLMSTQTVKLWKKKQFRAFLFLSWSILLLFICCGLVFIHWTENATRDNIREKLSDLAKTIAVGVEELGHQKISLDTPQDDPHYISIMKTMKDWLRKIPTIASLYTMRTNEDGELIFIAEPGSDLNRDGQFDPETENDKPIGNPYEESLEDLPEFIDAFNGKSGFNGVPMEDIYGWWITAAEPLYDSQGNVEAALGVDFWSESWTREIQNSKFWPTLFFISFLILFFVVLVFLQSHFANEEKLGSYAHDLEKTVKDLVEANRQADLAIRAKGDFLTNMSHEIRTPMNAIFGFTDILTRRLMDRCLPHERAECQEISSLLLRSGNDLLTMINDILDFSQADDQQLKLKNIPVSISQIIDDVEPMMRERLKTKPQLKLIFKNDGNIPDWIRSDPGRIRQIITHLIGNAIKFTEHGSIKVRYGVIFNDSRQVKNIETSIGISPTSSITSFTSTLTSQLTQTNITATNFTTSNLIAINEMKAKTAEKIFYFTVKDTGIGIAKEDISKVFQPFSQVDSSLTRRFGGTGLGLAIARRLALLLGGDISVTSELNQGSVFQLTLPIDECNTKPEQAGMETMFRMPTISKDQIEKNLEAEHSKTNKTKKSESLNDFYGAQILPSYSEPQTTIFSQSTLNDADELEKLAAMKAESQKLGSNGKITVVQALTNYRILVVEDGHINQIVISSQLREAGAEVVIAENGQVALDAVETAEKENQSFDAILMDMQMPVMDGYEATTKLRERGYNRPIIALTAHTLSGDCEKTLEAGCDAYMSKPVAFKKLISLIVSGKRK